jgi:hypothetical protein
MAADSATTTLTKFHAKVIKIGTIGTIGTIATTLPRPPRLAPSTTILRHSTVYDEDSQWTSLRRFAKPARRQRSISATGGHPPDPQALVLTVWMSGEN